MARKQLCSKNITTGKTPDIRKMLIFTAGNGQNTGSNRKCKNDIIMYRIFDSFV